jgi:hypothetical protein
MKTLMYPIAPDDDFPEMFCAIRQGSGEHWFYTPVGEDASWMLFRAESENAKLRELVADMWACISHIGEYDAFYYDMAKDGCGISCTVNGEHCCADKLYDRMHKLGIEVD